MSSAAAVGTLGTETRKMALLLLTIYTIAAVPRGAHKSLARARGTRMTGRYEYVQT